MRHATIVLALAALLAGLAGEAAAQAKKKSSPQSTVKPFCSQDSDGIVLCYYDTIEQCRASMRGVAGSCYANPAAGR